jgi:hypothetical protein
MSNGQRTYVNSANYREWIQRFLISVIRVEDGHNRVLGGKD